MLRLRGKLVAGLAGAFLLERFGGTNVVGWCVGWI